MQNTIDNVEVSRKSKKRKSKKKSQKNEIQKLTIETKQPTTLFQNQFDNGEDSPLDSTGKILDGDPFEDSLVSSGVDFPITTYNSNKTDEDEFLEDKPKLIIYDDVSASSAVSLDVQLELEIDSQEKIQSILDAVERELYCPNTAAPGIKEVKQVLSREKMHPWRSLYPQLSDIKKKKSFQEEFMNHCEEWRESFCHIGVFGGKCIPTQANEKDDNDPLLERDVRSMNHEEAMFGGFVEEVIESHGDYEEVFAYDNGEENTKRQVLRQNRYKKLGFPPLSPLSNVKENIYSDLFDIIWKELVPKMMPVLIRMQELGDAIAKEDREARYANEAKNKKILMKPSKTLKNQKIEYGLESAVRVRSYTTKRADQSGGSTSYSRHTSKHHLYHLQEETKHYEPPVDTDRSHYEESCYDEGPLEVIEEDDDTQHKYNNDKWKRSTIPPSTQESLYSGYNSNMNSPRAQTAKKPLPTPPRSAYSSQFPVRQHSKYTISGGFKFNNEPTQRSQKQKKNRVLPILVDKRDPSAQSQAWKRPPKIVKATPSTSHGRPGPPTLTKPLMFKEVTASSTSRLPTLEGKQEPRAQSAVPSMFVLQSLSNSRPPSQHNRLVIDDEENHYDEKKIEQRAMLFSSPGIVQKQELVSRTKRPEKKKKKSSDNSLNFLRDVWDNSNFNPDPGSQSNPNWCTTTIRE